MSIREFDFETPYGVKARKVMSDTAQELIEYVEKHVVEQKDANFGGNRWTNFEEFKDDIESWADNFKFKEIGVEGRIFDNRGPLYDTTIVVLEKEDFEFVNMIQNDPRVHKIIFADEVTLNYENNTIQVWYD